MGMHGIGMMVRANVDMDKRTIIYHRGHCQSLSIVTSYIQMTRCTFPAEGSSHTTNLPFFRSLPFFSFPSAVKKKFHFISIPLASPFWTE